MKNNLNTDYLKINKASWNNRTDTHIKSDFYDVKSFLNGKSSLNKIELDLLGDIKHKNVLHLQCHFGQDTISMSRLGAKTTGVDLSDTAIQRAKEYAIKTQVDSRFICCDIYDLPNHLEEQFDIVFTSYGTIGWLPDLAKWANIVSRFLKPNGKFIFVEFHPVVWMFNDDFDNIAYSYFNTGPIQESENGTYADRTATIEQDYVMWNHSISEVINNLIKNDLEIKSMDEFNYSPYACFKHTVALIPDEHHIEHLEDKIPMVYSVVATKKIKSK
jgi:SAM-dependent methyltransferase